MPQKRADGLQARLGRTRHPSSQAGPTAGRLGNPTTLSHSPARRPAHSDGVTGRHRRFPPWSSTEWTPQERGPMSPLGRLHAAARRLAQCLVQATLVGTTKMIWAATTVTSRPGRRTADCRGDWFQTGSLGQTPNSTPWRSRVVRAGRSDLQFLSLPPSIPSSQAWLCGFKGDTAVGQNPAQHSRHSATGSCDF